MKYPEFKRVYLEKKVTFEQWQTEKVKNALQAVMIENKIRGELVYPPPQTDFNDFKFDAEHTQGDKHPHDVTEAEARSFIKDAYFMIKTWNGVSWNYYGERGAAFVRIDLKTIRTAFKAAEYDAKITKLIEAYKNAVKKYFAH